MSFRQIPVAFSAAVLLALFVSACETDLKLNSSSDMSIQPLNTDDGLEFGLRIRKCEDCSGGPSPAPTPTPVQLQTALGDPISGLSATALDRFLKGKERFEHSFTAAEGFGPTFNDSLFGIPNSCAGCHASPVTGGAQGSLNESVRRFGVLTDRVFDEFGEISNGIFDALDGSSALPDRGGSLLQNSSIPGSCPDGPVPDEFPDLVEATRFTTPVFGMGLVEAIPDSAIEQIALNQANDLSPLAVSGKVSRVCPLEIGDVNPTADCVSDASLLRVGRFGWKAQAATVLSFSADAALNEMGITNRLLREESRPGGVVLPTCAQNPAHPCCDPVADDPYEDLPSLDPHGENIAFIERISDFQKYLAPPPQMPKSGLRGEQVFTNIGCAKCHVTSSFTTVSADLALHGKSIKPYSDFLLHHMGGGGDLIVQGDAGIREMRTAPLWGLGDRSFAGHDGHGNPATRYCREQSDPFTEPRFCRSFLEQTHQGEARASVNAYKALSTANADDLAAFLFSLGQREFDMARTFDASNPPQINLEDFNGLRYGNVITAYTFYSCFQGFGICDPLFPSYQPDASCSQGVVFYDVNHPCSVSDVNRDLHVNLADFDYFLQVYVGPEKGQDCNWNGNDDLKDILVGTETDLNTDGIPDSCI
ncbi:MAG TPA: di-heme oxidoredictase family protein [Bdellovibrionota bacterium]|nr:di-heme oxidoredictase family protein [Bdellovibrionota bacterium]